MTPREQELARRHLAALEDMRDNAWCSVHGDHAYPSHALARHAALDYAVKIVRAQFEPAAANVSTNAA